MKIPVKICTVSTVEGFLASDRKIFHSVGLYKKYCCYAFASEKATENFLHTRTIFKGKLISRHMCSTIALHFPVLLSSKCPQLDYYTQYDQSALFFVFFKQKITLLKPFYVMIFNDKKR